MFLSSPFQVRSFCIFVSKPPSASDDQLFRELLESVTAKIFLMTVYYCVLSIVLSTFPEEVQY